MDREAHAAASSSRNAKIDGQEKPDASRRAALSSRDAAIRLLARAEQCTTLLRQKLIARSYDTDEVDAALAELTKAGYLDDSRFCGSWLRSRFRAKAESPRKALAALIAKGINSSTAKAALAATLDLEAETALLERFMYKNRAHFDTGKPGYGLSERDSSIRNTLKAEGFSREAVEQVLEGG